MAIIPRYLPSKRPVVCWVIAENMDRSEAGYVLKDDAYSGFLNFARTENVPPSKIPPTPETFAKAIFKYGFAPARVRVDGARVHEMVTRAAPSMDRLLPPRTQWTGCKVP